MRVSQTEKSGFIVAQEQYVQKLGGMKGIACLGMAYSLRVGGEVAGRR